MKRNSDLKGLEDVITQEIIAGGNFFTNIDLSYNNSLTNIHIDGGDVTEIIFNSTIQTINVSNTPLTEVDLTNLNDLADLVLFNNELNSLDISNSPLWLKVTQVILIFEVIIFHV